MTFFISMFSYAIEFVISLYYYNDIFLARMKTKHLCLIGAILYSVAFLLFIASNNVIMNISVFLFINFIFSFSCYKSNVKKSVLSSLFLTAIMMGTEFLAMSILSLANRGNINTYNSSIAAYAISVIFSKTLFFILIKASIALGFYLTKRKASKTPAFLFLFPFCSLIILYTFWAISSNYELSETLDLTVAVAGITILTSVILTYIFYGKTTKELDELYKAQSETDKINTDIAFYSILDKQNEILKTFVHNEKNHLTVIKSLSDDPSINAYIDEIYGQIKYYSMFGNTKNKMLDLMINKYQHICKNENIDFSVTIKTANLSFLEQSDTITLLSNILDNSVEAAKTSTEKTIDLSINKVNGFDILTCSNSYGNKPTVVGKTLKTTKTDKGIHGIGIKSIQNIVNKYHGEFEWSFDEDSEVFNVYIAFKQRT